MTSVGEDSDTFALALVGAGIGGSLTPAMHENEGRAQGLSVTYRRVDLEALGLGVGDLPEVLNWARRFGLDGLNITHPCKQAVLPLLDQVAPSAAAIGAVNTVVISEGRLTGHNTDASGFVAALRHALPDALAGAAVLLGAGGAGSAVAYAVLAAGMPHLTVVDVDVSRREALVSHLADRFSADRVAAAATAEVPLARAGGFINATPIGMAGRPGLPLDEGLVRPDLWVADIVYVPVKTPLVRLARSRGCRVMDGAGMAVRQAVAAFQLFTGRSADADRMHAHFARLLSGGESSEREPQRFGA